MRGVVDLSATKPNMSSMLVSWFGQLVPFLYCSICSVLTWLFLVVAGMEEEEKEQKLVLD